MYWFFGADQADIQQDRGGPIPLWSGGPGSCHNRRQRLPRETRGHSQTTRNESVLGCRAESMLCAEMVSVEVVCKNALSLFARACVLKWFLLKFFFCKNALSLFRSCLCAGMVSVEVAFKNDSVQRTVLTRLKSENALTIFAHTKLNTSARAERAKRKHKRAIVDTIYIYIYI
jgi:hypothetical protein